MNLGGEIPRGDHPSSQKLGSGNPYALIQPDKPLTRAYDSLTPDIPGEAADNPDQAAAPPFPAPSNTTALPPPRIKRPESATTLDQQHLSDGGKPGPGSETEVAVNPAPSPNRSAELPQTSPDQAQTPGTPDGDTEPETPAPASGDIPPQEPPDDKILPSPGEHPGPDWHGDDPNQEAGEPRSIEAPRVTTPALARFGAEVGKLDTSVSSALVNVRALQRQVETTIRDPQLKETLLATSKR